MRAEVREEIGPFILTATLIFFSLAMHQMLNCNVKNVAFWTHIELETQLFAAV